MINESCIERRESITCVTEKNDSVQPKMPMLPDRA